MGDFSYYNIFETKGIEYLLTILFFVILIPFWIILNKPVKLKYQMNKAFGVLTAGILRIPKGLFFNKNHTWTYLEKSGTAKVGIDDFIQHITGKVKLDLSKNIGDEIKKGDVMTEIEQNGKKLKILAPISGRIVEINKILGNNPDIINDDPYDKGWIYSIKPTRWIKETNSCFLAEDAVKWISRELERFKDFLAVSLHKHTPELSMIALQDGGELKDKTLSELPGDVWDDFQKEFLD